MRIREYVNQHGEECREIILEREEQKEWFEDCVRTVLSDTRRILDELEYLPEFKVNWEDYHRKRPKDL